MWYKEDITSVVTPEDQSGQLEDAYLCFEIQSHFQSQNHIGHVLSCKDLFLYEYKKTGYLD